MPTRSHEPRWRTSTASRSGATTKNKSERKSIRQCEASASAPEHPGGGRNTVRLSSPTLHHIVIGPSAGALREGRRRRDGAPGTTAIVLLLTHNGGRKDAAMDWEAGGLPGTNPHRHRWSEPARRASRSVRCAHIYTPCTSPLCSHPSLSRRRTARRCAADGAPQRVGLSLGVRAIDAMLAGWTSHRRRLRRSLLCARRDVIKPNELVNRRKFWARPCALPKPARTHKSDRLGKKYVHVRSRSGR